MNIDNLHQKHHGLPGVGFSSGKNGQDGEGGNNVYFGYINEFFETIDMTADNLIRIATSEDGYYTGMFIDTRAGDTSVWHWDSSLMDLSEEEREELQKKTHFLEIMEDPGYPGRYNYTFDGSTNNMRMYIKADTAETGKPQAWNKDTLREEGRWEDVVDGEQPFEKIPEPGIYPYVAYSGSKD